MELYLIRHGQSFNNALMEDINKRVKDPNLTGVGVQQAAHVAQFLSEATNLEQIVRHSADSPQRHEAHTHDITHLYCSPMRRAMQTAQPIASALDIVPEVWVDIHEHGGIWLLVDGEEQGFTGMTRAEIEAEFPGYVLPETITESGWYRPEQKQEPYEIAAARAMRIARDLRIRAASDTGKDDKLAIVTHGTLIDLLLKALLHRLPGDSFFHWHYNTGITRLDFLEDGRMSVRYINRVTHLPPELVT